MNRPNASFFDAPVEPQISRIASRHSGRRPRRSSNPATFATADCCLKTLTANATAGFSASSSRVCVRRHFFYDFAFLPYHAFEDPFRCCECNTGYCLPGDPVST